MRLSTPVSYTHLVVYTSWSDHLLHDVDETIPGESGYVSAALGCYLMLTMQYVISVMFTRVKWISERPFSVIDHITVSLRSYFGGLGRSDNCVN